MKRERAVFCCPGCGKMLAGKYRYCGRCEEKRSRQAVATVDGFKQLPLFVEEK